MLSLSSQWTLSLTFPLFSRVRQEVSSVRETVEPRLCLEQMRMSDPDFLKRTHCMQTCLGVSKQASLSVIVCPKIFNISRIIRACSCPRRLILLKWMENPKEKSRAWTTLASQNACRTFEAPLKPLCKLYCFQSSEISGTYATWGDKRAVAGPPSHPPLSPSYTTSMPSSGESRLAPRGEFLSPSGETLY